MHDEDEKTHFILEKLRDIHATQKRFGLFMALFSLLVILPVMAMNGLLLASFFYGIAQIGELPEEREARRLSRQIEENIEETEKALFRLGDSMNEMIEKALPYEPQNFKK